ncbi:MAG: sialate O-acetylesterase [Desulfobacterales bacterium]|nr:sialate O-acetylesterase [Desulfobacterales bacterium]
MKKFLTIIFVLMLLSPAAAWLMRLDLDLGVKRLGLKPPRFDARLLLENDVYRSFDQYLNDSFSVRDPLILAKRWLDYHLFGMTDTGAVHVGSQGWLYSRQSIADVQKDACDDAALIEQLALSLHAIELTIAAADRRFLFMVAPNKSTIYPEFLGFIPSDRICRQSHYDLLLEAFERHPLKGFVRLDNRLRYAKSSEHLLYNPGSRYWNARGAGVAAEAIAEKIFQTDDRHHRFDVRPIDLQQQADLARRMLGLHTRIANDALIQLTSAESSEGLSAVVFGDAYFNSLVPYLSQTLRQLTVINAERFSSGLPGENWHSADLVVLEKAESELASLRLEMDWIFSIFGDRLRIPSNEAIDLQAFKPLANISFNQRSEGLEVKSVGNASRLMLEPIAGSDSHEFRILKLRVDAPHSDIMTIGFNTHPPQVSHKTVKKGTTELYLPLPFQPRLSLMITPGSKPGVLMMQSAEILNFNNRPQPVRPPNSQTLLAETPSKSEVGSKKPDSEKNTARTDRKADISEAGPQTADAIAKPRSPAVSGHQAVSIKKDQTDPSAPPQAKDRLSNPAQPAVASPRRETPDTTISGTQKERQILPPAAAVSGSTAIRLTDFADGQIFQRLGDSADIVISGTYSGAVEAIEARVVQSDSQMEVVTWTIIDSSLENGIFVGQLTQVPQGGWYTLQVRSHSDHRVFDNGKHRWGVGMLIGCLGQSNMKEWFNTGKDLKAHPLLRKYDSSGWSALDTKGNAAIAFGNRIIERLGIPVGLLDFAVNGSGLRKESDWGTGYWTDTTPGSIYNRFVKAVSAAGGSLEFIIWIQGEADAARGTVSREAYVDALTHFIENQVRNDINNGATREQLPFLLVMMIKRPGGKDKPHQDIRDAQKQIVDSVAECYLAATTLDLKNHGRQHLQPKAYISLGNRVAQTALYVLGLEQYHRGPQVVYTRRLDEYTIEIIIRHRGGSDFTPVSGISGWEIVVNGNQVPIDKVYRHDTDTIRIVTRNAFTEQASIHYLYGAMPDVHHPVVDNSPLSLPLEEYQSVIN